ncbi:MAG: hypothetical protein AB7U82_24400, partial [Blastocatellales bacterium]
MRNADFRIPHSERVLKLPFSLAQPFTAGESGESLFNPVHRACREALATNDTRLKPIERTVNRPCYSSMLALPAVNGWAKEKQATEANFK